MKKTNISVLNEKIVYDGDLKISQSSIVNKCLNGEKIEYNTQKIIVPNTVAGLIYNIDSESIVLIKQYRYPIQTKKNNGFIYESIYGEICKGETPIQTFIKKCLQDAKYNIKESDVEYCFLCYNSANYLTEKVYYFVATVSNKDKVNLNVNDEKVKQNSNSEVCEINYLQFRSMMPTVEDVKVKVLAYELHYRNIFDKIR